MHRLLLVAFMLSSAVAIADHAPSLPNPLLQYRIEVSLSPDNRQIKGTERINWQFPGSEPLQAVYLHLYLNAFAGQSSTWLRGMKSFSAPHTLEELLEAYEDPWGFCRPERIEQNGVSLTFQVVAPDDGNPQDRSLIRVELDQPLAPGQTLGLDISFVSQLPIPIARSGGVEDYFLAAHWYPKLAAYELAGVRQAPVDRFRAHQFHSATEFYANFANYDVSIAVPDGFSVAATGQRQADRPLFRYKQRAVHDFAFVAHRSLTQVSFVHDPTGPGGPTTVHILVPIGTEHQVERWKVALLGALDVMGLRVGPYPYKTITLVVPPLRGIRTMGMEYPTFILGGLGDPIVDHDWLRDSHFGETTIVHEFIHQYFYGLVASCEFEEAFLDEGFTTFWTSEVMQDIYGKGTTKAQMLGRALDSVASQHLQLSQARKWLRQPLRTRPSFLQQGRGTQFYKRPWASLRTAKARFGQKAIDRVFQTFFARWAFRHPDYQDFLEVAREVGPEQMVALIKEAYSAPRIPDYRIDDFESKRFKPSYGWISGSEGPLLVDLDNRQDYPTAGLDPSALEQDGRVLMIVRDPGWTMGEQQQTGSVERRMLVAQQKEAEPDYEPDQEKFYKSHVRVEGPGWKNLPVRMVFHFADGIVLEDNWDGRAFWREYDFVRAAPLWKAQIDPERLIQVDPNPDNNARLRRPSGNLGSDWGSWWGAFFQWVATSMGMWL